MDYATVDLLHCEYFSKYHRLAGIDLSKQIKLEKSAVMQQINFIGILNRDDRVSMFFIIEKSEETNFDFSQNPVRII